MTFTGKDGQRVKLWEQGCRDPRVDMADKQSSWIALWIGTSKSWPRAHRHLRQHHLAPGLDGRRIGNLLDPAPLQKVVDAALKYRVALEISASFKLPKLPFLKLAKAAGAKFSFGSNGATRTWANSSTACSCQGTGPQALRHVRPRPRRPQSRPAPKMIETRMAEPEKPFRIVELVVGKSPGSCSPSLGTSPRSRLFTTSAALVCRIQPSSSQGHDTVRFLPLTFAVMFVPGRRHRAVRHRADHRGRKALPDLIGGRHDVIMR